MQEDKTPYELAMEQNHQNVAAMIADLRDNGPLTLTKYERKKHRSSSQVSRHRLTFTLSLSLTLFFFLFSKCDDLQ